MANRISRHIRANVYGLIAVSIALGGTAYAVDGPLRGQDRIGSADIINGEVYSEDVANDDTGNALTGADVMPNSLTGADITGLGGADVTDGALTGADVFDNSLSGLDVAGIGSGDVTDGSLTGGDVLNQSLTGSDIQDNTVNADDVFGLRGNDDIENGSLTAADVADDSLTGTDINENSLAFGCRHGFIKGFALVKGSNAIPNDAYTTSSTYITDTYNCTGGAVAVKDLGGFDGNYDVRFTNVPWDVAFATSSADAEFEGNLSDQDNFVSAGFGGGAGDVVRVNVFDEDGSHESGWFYLVVM